MGAGYGGQFVSERVVRWERNANKINLCEVNYEVVADPKTPISLAVKAANNDAIIMSFPIAAFGREPGQEKAIDKDNEKDEKDAEKEETKKEQVTEKAESSEKPTEQATKKAAAQTNKDSKSKPAAKGTAVNASKTEDREYKETGKEPSIIIDVTRLFTSDVFELSARQRLNATSLDASRSYIERISPYPENIEVESTHTYTRMPTPASAARVENPFAQGGMRPGSATLVLHHSMVKLPEHPMTPRLFDDRVGYFTVCQMDYGRDEQRAPKRVYITRWRLEKKDPSAALSEPVKPIVYYIDAATPTKWVPWMIRGVESWQKAFEAAGFKNAIIAKPAPTPEQDPEFQPGGCALFRYSLAAFHHRKRDRAAHIRPAHRRNSKRGHSVLSQRHEPPARLVFPASGPARPARAEAAAARRSDGPSGRVCVCARSRPHARLPAQYESQLHVSAG